MGNFVWRDGLGDASVPALLLIHSRPYGYAFFPLKIPIPVSAVPTGVLVG